MIKIFSNSDKSDIIKTEFTSESLNSDSKEASFSEKIIKKVKDHNLGMV